MQALTNFRLVPGFSSRFFFLENILTGLWPALKGLASEGLHLYCWKLLSNAVLKFGLLESSEKKVDSSRDFTAKGTLSRRSLVALWWRRLAERGESHLWRLRVPSNLRLEEKNFHGFSQWQFGVLKKRHHLNIFSPRKSCHSLLRPIWRKHFVAILNFFGFATFWKPQIFGSCFQRI